MEYDLNQISDPTRFQRLVNAILIARFGEAARLTPLRGKDGGSDGEAVIVDVTDSAPRGRRMLFHDPLFEPPQPGRYLFQAKYHKTGEQRLSDLRTTVVSEFSESLNDDVLKRADRRDVTSFLLVTNVTSSKEALRKVGNVRGPVAKSRRSLQADVWWGERITAFLDWAPQLWSSFPEIFPGGVPPLMVQAFGQAREGKPKAFRLAIAQQHDKDERLNLLQVDAEKKLFDLFVDLDCEVRFDDEREFRVSLRGGSAVFISGEIGPRLRVRARPRERLNSALALLIDDNLAIPKILLEGGPGQGKSTITQMAAQIYREKFLGSQESQSRDPIWSQLCRVRLPIRLELRHFAQWLAVNPEGSLEGHIAAAISQDSGGTTVTVEDVHAAVEASSVILFLDGLDEIGNDEERDLVLDAIASTIKRFEGGLRADLRVVLTTRPPAVSGRGSKVRDFRRIVISPMDDQRIDDYVGRWLGVQPRDEEHAGRIKNSFEARRRDTHVHALARNPMQLSVLLQFIARRGEAFPDRRAELYREYFEVVIDRDVDKSPELAKNRDVMESLHAFLGFRLHGAAEIEGGSRSLDRQSIIELAGDWLEVEGQSKEAAEGFFALGEERFGLIVAVSGEGKETSYGFEVQPIQEYFAASYISNRIPEVKAHDVFEKLIHRPFWREVALFLAGLRRSNEKADLVGRARDADAAARGDKAMDGRVIILELLKEGVLSQPKNVLVSAMELVLELAEERALKLNRAPGALIAELCELIVRYGNVDSGCGVSQLAGSCSSTEDEELISHLHRLAASTLPRDRYTELVLGHGSTSSRVRSIVRLRCPYFALNVLEELGGEVSYWAGISLPDLARECWGAALRHGLVADVVLPNGTSRWLLVQLASSHAVYGREEANVLEIRGASASAAWKLRQNLDAMRVLLSRRSQEDASEFPRAREAGTIRLYDGEVDFDGLGHDEECVRELVGTSGDVVDALGEGGGATSSERVRAYMNAIERNLGRPGLAGWVACRCAVELLHSWEAFGRHIREDAVRDVLEKVGAFYGLEDLPLAWRHLALERSIFGVPMAFRASSGGDFVSVGRTVSALVAGGSMGDAGGAPEWTLHVPLSVRVIRELVEGHRDRLLELLMHLGDRMVVGDVLGRRLRIQDTRKVLGLCRRCNKPEVLRGAATVLLNAKFGRIADPEVVVKVLAAAPSSQLVDMVLDANRAFGGDDQELEPHGKLALAVAKLVLGDRKSHDFRVVNRAACFLEEVEASATVPLFQEFPALVEISV